jgi:anion-transporting  ArsA/GET3 family ATPase
MELEQFCSTSRVLIVAGKGGVGKTTVTASLATTAARAGLSVLIVEVEGKSGLSAAFGVPDLGYDEIDLAPGVRARTLTPDHALVDYLDSHGMKRISKRLSSTGTLDVVATAVPGMKDILVLGKVKSLERDRAADLILVDAPAAGHAVSFLLSPRGLLDAVSVGPIRKQASDVIELLSDPSRCQVLLVTIPEETPVNELVETAYSLEDEVGLSLGPVVINGLYPELEGLDRDPVEAAAEAGASLQPGEADALRAAAAFRRHRTELQREQVERLAERLPLPQIRLPYLFSADLGPPDVDLLADAVRTGVEELLEIPSGAA